VLVALQEKYGEPFKQDLAYLAIHEANMFDFDAVVPLMERLFGIRVAADHDRSFVRTLRHLPATSLSPTLLEGV
jgi:hypothetical protein